MRITSSAVRRRYVFVTYLKRSQPVLYKLATPQASLVLMYFYINSRLSDNEDSGVRFSVRESEFDEEAKFQYNLDLWRHSTADKNVSKRHFPPYCFFLFLTHASPSTSLDNFQRDWAPEIWPV
jgi:hypothetical protein